MDQSICFTWHPLDVMHGLLVGIGAGVFIWAVIKSILFWRRELFESELERSARATARRHARERLKKKP